MFVGSDWKGTPQWEKYEQELKPHGVEIVYLSHTDGISSTQLTGVIKGLLDEHPVAKEKWTGRECEENIVGDIVERDWNGEIKSQI